eukprot:9245082-Pyramimonas_sp.AAC.1
MAADKCSMHLAYALPPSESPPEDRAEMPASFKHAANTYDSSLLASLLSMAFRGLEAAPTKMAQEGPDEGPREPRNSPKSARERPES